MAIFRVMYYATITVGSGGRITIPQEMRDDLKVEDGGTLTARMEESENGQRQITLWKATTATPTH
ncbi:MAG: AbrB/MazE/SpoVT family DNA-binding domain-containing protein [Gemmatimonadota bacterium]